MTARTLVVWCPDWPATALGLDAAAPGAVTGGSLVVACTAAARAAGVRRGQRVRDARRRCPGLVARERDTDSEGRLFESVAAAVAAAVPWVEVVRPGVCAVPVHGVRYHGGEESLRVRARGAVVERGFDCDAGIADGLFAAELAARAGGAVVPAGGAAAFLAPFPVAVLGRPELADLLSRLGVRTLGEFAALPARRVAARFGADEVRAHRLARGLDPRAPLPRRPAADPSVTTRFDPPAEVAEQVVFAAKALAERLRAVLAARGLACLRLAVEVVGADGRELTRLWRHDGTPSAAAVAERVRWQLASWQTFPSPDPPPSPDEEGIGGITTLRLVPDQVAPEEGRQETLWGGAGETIERAAARIQAMLGHEAVTRPYPANGRAPADQVRRVPFGDRPRERRSQAGEGAPHRAMTVPEYGPWPGRVPDPPPAVVHAAPVPAEVVDASGEPVAVDERCAVSAPPHRVRIGGRSHPVAAWAGPWPAREHWWDPAQARHRFRFQVCTEDGRAHLLILEGGRWHAEAGYA